jgi:hypothetical protein
MSINTIETGFVLDPETIGQVIYLLRKVTLNDISSFDRELADTLLPIVDSIKCRAFYRHESDGVETDKAAN